MNKSGLIVNAGLLQEVPTIYTELTKEDKLSYFGANWGEKIIQVFLDYKAIQPRLGSGGTVDPLETYIFFDKGELKNNQHLLVISIDRDSYKKVS